MSAATPSHKRWLPLMWGAPLSKKNGWGGGGKQSASFSLYLLKEGFVLKPHQLTFVQITRERPDEVFVLLWDNNLTRWPLIFFFRCWVVLVCGFVLGFFFTHVERLLVDLQGQCHPNSESRSLPAPVGSDTETEWHPPRAWRRLQGQCWVLLSGPGLMCEPNPQCLIFTHTHTHTTQ